MGQLSRIVMVGEIVELYEGAFLHPIQKIYKIICSRRKQYAFLKAQKGRKTVDFK